RSLPDLQSRPASWADISQSREQLPTASVDEISSNTKDCFAHLYTKYPDDHIVLSGQEQIWWGLRTVTLPPGASSLNEEPSIVTIVDTEFENSPSRVNFLREFPETRMGDRVMGPYRQGQEVELPLWITTHLVQMGYAKFRDEDQLTLNT